MSKLLVVRRFLLDPHEPGPWIIAFSTVALLWLTFDGLPLGRRGYLCWEHVLLPCLTAAALVTAVHRRLGMVVVLTSPFVVTPLYNAALAVGDYARGTAVLKRRTEASGLDPDLRLHDQPPSCFRYSTEPFREDTYDLVLIALVRNLGPMPGAYVGPYPFRQEANQWLDEHEQEVPLSEAQLGRVVVDGHAFDISEHTHAIRHAQRPLTAALMDDQLLLLRWVDDSYRWMGAGPRRTVLMLDARTGVLRRRHVVAWYNEWIEAPPSTTPSE